MDARGVAGALVAEALPEGGPGVLATLGLGGDWDAVCARFPDALFAEVPEDDAGVQILMRLRDHLNRTDQLRPAVLLTRALGDLQQARKGADHPDAVYEVGTMGGLLLRAGKVPEGGKLLQEAYDKLRQRVGARDLRLGNIAASLGVWHQKNGQLDLAEQRLFQAYQIRKQVAPEANLVTTAQLGELYTARGLHEKALEMYRESWTFHLDIFGPEHPKTLARAKVLAGLLRQRKMFRESAPVLRDLYEHVKKSGDSEEIATVTFELGVALYHTWKKEEGLRLIEEAVKWSRQNSSEDRPHPTLPHRLAMFAQIQIDRARYEVAEGLYLECLEVERKLHGESHPDVAQRYAALGVFYIKLGRVDEGLGWMDVAAATFRSSVGLQDPRAQHHIEDYLDAVGPRIDAAVEGRDVALARQLMIRVEGLALASLGEKNAKWLAFKKARG